ncbi:MAG TPA: hypothetical protein VF746_31765 [Longimicrobium sp.]|jgi:hypothetical protein
MTTLAHQGLAASTAPEAARPDRTALYEAAGAEPLSWREKLRLPLVRPRSARALIHKYRLWTALEFAYDEVVRELGPVRVQKMEVHSDLDGSPYLTVEILAQTTEHEPLFEFESTLYTRLRERFARPDTLRRFLITISPDPDYLPLFA